MKEKETLSERLAKVASEYEDKATLELTQMREKDQSTLLTPSQDPKGTFQHGARAAGYTIAAGATLFAAGICGFASIGTTMFKNVFSSEDEK